MQPRPSTLDGAAGKTASSSLEGASDAQPLTPDLDGAKALLALTAILFVVVLVRTAWMCDDAFVTVRTALNLFEGHGLTWNPGERVQAFTHPLWLFVLCGGLALTREPYFTTVALSGICSLGAALLLCRLAPRLAVAPIALLALVSSRAFVDYSSSGLENPLSHLLLVAWILCWLRARGPRGIFWLSLLTSLLLLNRMDLGLLVAPPLLVAWLSAGPRRALRQLLAGMIPFLLWEAFSLFYYGFPFPNTYYAKLHTGIPLRALAGQGLGYLLNSLERDPITLPLCVLGALAPMLMRRRALVPFSIGVLAYLVYVVRIGGDFMSGRFLAAPFLIGVALLLCCMRGVRVAWATALLLLGFSFCGSSRPPLATFSSYGTAHGGDVDVRGISDERGYYYKKSGLLRARRNAGMPLFGWSEAYGRILREKTDGKTDAVVLGAIGIAGVHAGPKMHIVDPHALSDPLLARLPAIALDRELQRWREEMAAQQWRVGHFWRWIPPGYVDTLKTGKDKFQDRALAAYYQRLSLVVHAPLLAPGRLREIVRFNLGLNRLSIDLDAYRYPEAPHVRWTSSLAWRRKPGTPWDAPDNTRLTEKGIIIELGRTLRSALIELTLDGDDDYLLVWALGHEELAAVELAGRKPTPPGLDRHVVEVPRRAASRGYDRVIIIPLRGKGGYSLGHLTTL